MEQLADFFVMFARDGTIFRFPVGNKPLGCFLRVSQRHAEGFLCQARCFACTLQNFIRWR